jgi:hypothetical protein
LLAGKHTLFTTRREGAMLSRLANVVYWTGCVLATLFIGGALCLVKFGDIPPQGQTFVLAIGGVLGVLVWLGGRAVLYILGDQ